MREEATSPGFQEIFSKGPHRILRRTVIDKQYTQNQDDHFSKRARNIMVYQLRSLTWLQLQLTAPNLSYGKIKSSKSEASTSAEILENFPLQNLMPQHQQNFLRWLLPCHHHRHLFPQLLLSGLITPSSFLAHSPLFLASLVIYRPEMHANHGRQINKYLKIK